MLDNAFLFYLKIYTFNLSFMIYKCHVEDTWKILILPTLIYNKNLDY